MGICSSSNEVGILMPDSKILVVGERFVGKATLLKQLRIKLVSPPFEECDVKWTAGLIRETLLENIVSLGEKVILPDSIAEGDDEIHDDDQLLVDFDTLTTFLTEYKLRDGVGAGLKREKGRLATLMAEDGRRHSQRPSLPSLSFRLKTTSSCAVALAEAPRKVWEATERMWRDERIRKLYDDALLRDDAKSLKLRGDYRYFMQHTPRCTDPNYVPTTDDMLRVKHDTLGMQSITLGICSKSLPQVKAAEPDTAKVKIMVKNIGVEESRKPEKWPDHAKNVHCIVYVLSLGDYDQVRRDPANTKGQLRSRLKDQLDLLRTMCNSELFLKCPIMVVLNKVDVFTEKIGCAERGDTEYELKRYFEDYKGWPNAKEAIQYFKDLVAEILQGGLNKSGSLGEESVKRLILEGSLHDTLRATKIIDSIFQYIYISRLMNTRRNITKRSFTSISL